jgi:hypothetical protein
MRLITCLAIAAFPAVLAITGCTEADFNAPGTGDDYEVQRPITDPDADDLDDADTIPDGGVVTPPGPLTPPGGATTPPASQNPPPTTDPEAGAPSETGTPPQDGGANQPAQPG